MANQQLLLLEPIDNLGNEGDEVSVKAGFARNYLLPLGKAVPLTKANKKQMEVLRARAAKRLQEQLEGAQQLAARIETVNIAFAVQTGPGGRMFGSITAADIAKRLAEDGIEIDKRHVHLGQNVKELGKHTTKIKLHAEVSVELSFEVVSENPIEEIEGEGEASEAAAEAKA